MLPSRGDAASVGTTGRVGRRTRVRRRRTRIRLLRRRRRRPRWQSSVRAQCLHIAGMHQTDGDAPRRRRGRVRLNEGRGDAPVQRLVQSRSGSVGEGWSYTRMPPSMPTPTPTPTPPWGGWMQRQSTDAYLTSPDTVSYNIVLGGQWMRFLFGSLHLEQIRIIHQNACDHHLPNLPGH